MAQELKESFCIDAELFIKFICQEKMAEKVFYIIFVLFPVSVVLTFLTIRYFKIERKITYYLIIFTAIFGTLTLIFLIFTIQVLLCKTKYSHLCRGLIHQSNIGCRGLIHQTQLFIFIMGTVPIFMPFLPFFLFICMKKGVFDKSNTYTR